MDLFIQIILIILMLICNALVIKKVKNIINPVSIISFWFFIPLFFALTRMSGLQNERWHFKTYIIIIESIVFWLIYPSLSILFSKNNFINNQISLKKYMNKKFKLIIRFFSISVVAAYLLINYIQTKLIFPIINPDIAHDIHTQFLSLSHIIVRSTPLAVGLLFILFYIYRKKVDILLLSITLVTPLTRLSRIDVFMSLIVLIVLNSKFEVIKITYKNILFKIIPLLLLLITGLTYLGNARLNRFGEYSISYVDIMKWKWVAGPFEVFPVIYAYFPFSFENFDLFVRQNLNISHSFGLGSFHWLLVGFLKLNWIDGFSDIYMNIDLQPLIGGATVSTILKIFYIDFDILAGLPMFFYMLLWINIYKMSNNSLFYTMIYALLSAGYALSSFQPILNAPLIFNQIFLLLLIFLLYSKKLFGFGPKKPK